MRAAASHIRLLAGLVDFAILIRVQFIRLLLRAAPLINAPVSALADSKRFGWLVNRNIAMVTYTGRRSGREFSIPVTVRLDH